MKQQALLLLPRPTDPDPHNRFSVQQKEKKNLAPFVLFFFTHHMKRQQLRFHIRLFKKNTQKCEVKRKKVNHTDQRLVHLKARSRLTIHREWAFQDTQWGKMISGDWTLTLQSTMKTSVYYYLSGVHGKYRDNWRRSLYEGRRGGKKIAFFKRSNQ